MSVCLHAAAERCEPTEGILHTLHIIEMYNEYNQYDEICSQFMLDKKLPCGGENEVFFSGSSTEQHLGIITQWADI